MCIKPRELLKASDISPCVLVTFVASRSRPSVLIDHAARRRGGNGRRFNQSMTLERGHWTLA